MPHLGFPWRPHHSPSRPPTSSYIRGLAKSYVIFMSEV